MQSSQKTSTMSLNTNEINALLMRLRYQHFLPLLETESKHLPRDYFRIALLSYGYTHSAREAKQGFFSDAYMREPNDPDFNNGNKLLSFALVNHPQYGDGLLVQDEPVMRTIKKPPRTTYHQTTYNDRPTGFLAVARCINSCCDSSYCQNICKVTINYLKDLGLFQNKDMLFSSAALEYDFEAIFGKNENNALLPLYSQYSSNNPRNPWAILNEAKFPQKNKIAHFYLGVLRKLLNPISTELASQVEKDTSSRLAFILEMVIARYLEKKIFSVLMSYAFDEIMLLRMLKHSFYTLEQVQTILREFATNIYSLDAPPEHVALASSGMHATSNAMFAAFEEVKEQKEYRVYAEAHSYHQFLHVYERIKLTTDALEEHREDTCTTFGDGKPQIVPFENQLVDIMLCAFEENPALHISEFESNDIVEKINVQLALREEINSNARLIVVIDTTASLIDDVHLGFLITIHAQAIQSGKLAIITCNSLTKYLQMGFDKLPAGWNVMFFNENAFPVLKEWKEKKDCLGGFELRDPTIQMLMYTIHHAREDIFNYSHFTRGNSRYIHEQLVPREIYTTPQSFVSIDFPYTRDKNVWGFLVIKLNVDNGPFNSEKNNQLLAKLIQGKIINLVKMLGIQYRDGYGHGETTYLDMGNIDDEEQFGIVRISIGIESITELNRMFIPLISYIMTISHLVRHAKKDSNDIDQQLAEIHSEFSIRLEFDIEIRKVGLLTDRLSEIAAKESLNPELQKRIMIIALRRKDYCLILALFKNPTFVINHQYEDGMTLFQELFSTNRTHLNLVKIFLQNKKLNLDCQDHHGRTALHLATVNGDITSIALLIINGANPELKINNKNRPVDICNQPEIQTILEFKVSPEQIHWLHRQIDILKELFQKKLKDKNPFFNQIKRIYEDIHQVCDQKSPESDAVKFFKAVKTLRHHFDEALEYEIKNWKNVHVMLNLFEAKPTVDMTLADGLYHILKTIEVDLLNRNYCFQGVSFFLPNKPFKKAENFPQEFPVLDVPLQQTLREFAAKWFP